MEKDAIKLAGNLPHTVESLSEDLKKIGLKKGDICLVHSSLSALGWVCGGPMGVIEALQHVLRKSGTLVMPTHSGDLSDPSRWEYPPVPKHWWPIIREAMPAFDPAATKTRGMGVIPETFRKYRGVKRSMHPQYSFSAWGRKAGFITKNHRLELSLGLGSPLDKLYRLKAKVLLLGVGHDSNTSLHLAEYLAKYPGKVWYKDGAPVMEKGRRIWKEIEALEFEMDDFKTIGADFEKEFGLSRKKIGSADSVLFSQRDLVDFAVRKMESTRL